MHCILYCHWCTSRRINVIPNKWLATVPSMLVMEWFIRHSWWSAKNSYAQSRAISCNEALTYPFIQWQSMTYRCNSIYTCKWKWCYIKNCETYSWNIFCSINTFIFLRFERPPNLTCTRKTSPSSKLPIGNLALDEALPSLRRRHWWPNREFLGASSVPASPRKDELVQNYHPVMIKIKLRPQKGYL